MKQVIFSNDAAAKSRNLADLIKGNLTADIKGDTAYITEIDKHACYDKNLPEGITAEQVEIMSKYNGSFSRGQHLAVGEMSASVFNSNKDVKRVEAVVGVFGHGDFSTITVERSRTFPNNKAKEGEPNTVDKPLYMVESTTYKGMSFKSLKKAMSEEFKG